ncbi:MAG TPA: RDD family protein [Candidatus Aquicultor sp.]|jgi:uncharacterized RDD family membrane protein YckC
MENSYDYAGLVRRAVAFMIDLLLIIVFLRIVYFRPNTFSGIIDFRMLSIAVLIVVYETLLIYYLGATIGKLAVGVTVIDAATSERPSPTQCIIRPFAKIAFAIWTINNTFLIFIAFAFSVLNIAKSQADSEHRSIHDIAARTLVVRSRSISA